MIPGFKIQNIQPKPPAFAALLLVLVCWCLSVSYRFFWCCRLSSCPVLCCVGVILLCIWPCLGSVIPHLCGGHKNKKKDWCLVYSYRISYLVRQDKTRQDNTRQDNTRQHNITQDYLLLSCRVPLYSFFILLIFSCLLSSFFFSRLSLCLISREKKEQKCCPVHRSTF